MERIKIDQPELENILQIRRKIDHVERYLLIRRYLYGHVFDYGCGQGYGSFLMSQAPFVSRVFSYDVENVFEKSFENEKIIYSNTFRKANVFVSLEVIEHVENPSDFVDAVDSVSPEMAIISYPNKPSTMFNPFHKHDYTRQNVCDIMKDYIPIKEIVINDVTILIFVIAPKTMPYQLYKNILEV